MLLQAKRLQQVIWCGWHNHQTRLPPPPPFTLFYSKENISSVCYALQKCLEHRQ